jgi:predicted TIM-barrel fold metal-dependent hydrolase
LLQWVIVNPLQPSTFEQAARMLQQPQCAGIKIHPQRHEYAIRQYGPAVFEFAAKHDAILLTHSGDTNCWPQEFVELADAHANVKLILAHLGNGGSATGDVTLQVRAVQASRHGNIFTDTSSVRSVLPGLIEWAVYEAGADRILYGSDTPLYFAPMQRARIDHADIGDGDKRRILCDNAAELFGLK